MFSRRRMVSSSVTLLFSLCSALSTMLLPMYESRQCEAAAKKIRFLASSWYSFMLLNRALGVLPGALITECGLPLALELFLGEHLSISQHLLQPVEYEKYADHVLKLNWIRGVEVLSLE